MHIAIISDIHGNYRALLAVLAEFSKYKIDRLVILGDIIGYYSGALQVMELLKSLNIDIKTVLGNHEVMLQKAEGGSLDWSWVAHKYGPALKRASDELSSEDKEWLYSLPQEIVINTDIGSVLLTHAPGGPEGSYVYPDQERGGISEVFNSYLKYDIVLYGHTHRSMLVSIDKTQIINPGSIGQSRDRSGLADWSILNTDNGVIRFMATPYDVAALITELENDQESMPYLLEVLRR